MALSYHSIYLCFSYSADVFKDQELGLHLALYYYLQCLDAFLEEFWEMNFEHLSEYDVEALPHSVCPK